VALIDEKAESMAEEPVGGSGNGHAAVTTSGCAEDHAGFREFARREAAGNDAVAPADREMVEPVPPALPAHDPADFTVEPALRSGRDYDYFRDVRAAVSRLRAGHNGPERDGRESQHVEG
jgi:hypothetical protein